MEITSKYYTTIMNTNVKKQHYVWRNYLSPWKLNPKEKKIWTYVFETNKVKYISLMGVAQESYFYKMYELTPIEILACWNFAKQFPPIIWPIAESLLKGYEAISNNMMSETDKRDFLLHVLDNMQTSIEKLGKPLLGCRTLEDLKNIPDKYQAVNYLCFQYSRTKKMRENGIQGYKEQNKPLLSELYRKAFPFISIIMATKLGYSIAVANPDTKYIFVRNESSIPFITCDQPAINTRIDELDDSGNVKAFELYYPTSPTTAIMIVFNPQLEEYSEIIADKDFVDDKNKKMCENALSFIFGNSENILKKCIFNNINIT